VSVRNNKLPHAMVLEPKFCLKGTEKKGKEKRKNHTVNAGSFLCGESPKKFLA